MTEFKITPKVVVVVLMITAFALPRMVDRTTWYGSLISWLCIFVLVGCAIFEIITWTNKKKYTNAAQESTPTLEN